MLRQPAVANRFYPGSARELEQTIARLLPKDDIAQTQAIAAVSPHAGYIYSGKLAASTLSRISIPQTVIVLGPNHHGQGAPVAVSTASWDMPGGIVSADVETATKLIEASSQITVDESAHRNEHSLEVQIPLLQTLQPDLSIVPVVIGSINYQVCTEVGQAIARVVDSCAKQILILASTDMSHYESRAAASAKDRKALDRITCLDPEGLYHTVLSENISMCGVIPVTIALIAAEQLGATQAELVDYTDSGAVSGDTDQVVGYAGLIIS